MILFFFFFLNYLDKNILNILNTTYTNMYNIQILYKYMYDIEKYNIQSYNFLFN